MEKHKKLYDFLLESDELGYGMSGKWEKDKKRFCEMQEDINNLDVNIDLDDEEYTY